MRAMSKAATVRWLIVAIGLGWGGLAHAQDGDGGGTRPNAAEAMQGGGMTEDRQLDDARAREHFQIATRYYDEGRFREAAAQFEEAFQLSRRGELLYNAYIAYRDAHEPEEAARTLEMYLDNTPDAPDRVNLQARLEELRRAVAEEQQSAEDLERANAAAEAERQRAEAEAARAAEAEAQPEVWPWIILGVGAAAAIAGGIVGGLALSDSSAILDTCGENGFCRVSSAENLNEMRDGAKNLALAADIMLFGGGAIALTGLILGLTVGLGGGGDDSDDGDADVEASAQCGPGYCGAQLRGTF